MPPKYRASSPCAGPRAGETLEALNGKTYALDPSVLVIADARGPESLAGIMGGEASGCDEATTDVLIESALWDPTDVAATGRKFGIGSDARYRFERGVDPAFCVAGLELATKLVLDLCGGEPSDLAVAGSVPVPDHRIDFPLERGEAPHRARPAVRPRWHGILDRLGFELESSDIADYADRIVARAPSWRPDVQGKGRSRGGDRAYRRPTISVAAQFRLPRQSAARAAPPCSPRCRSAPGSRSARSAG